MNMLRHSIKQAWQVLKQNRLYCFIYMLATAFSISMIMVLAIVFYLKVANVYPETGRDRMLVFRFGEIVQPDGSRRISRLSLETIQKCIYSLQTPEAVTAIYEGWGEVQIQPDNSAELISPTSKYVDTGFWKVFSFHFTDGAPFTDADMQSGIQTAVISEPLARQLFGTTKAAGLYITINFKPYRVCGVVEEPSYITERTYAQIWLPYSAHPNLVTSWGNTENTLGNFGAYVLAPSVKEVEKVKKEMEEMIRRYDSSLESIQFTVNGQPDRYWLSIFRLSSRQDIHATKIILRYMLLFLLLLLVPAISLAGMADSQMERRLSEMGVRRVFGAMKGGLMKQLMVENMLFTFMGAVTGLLFSYLLVHLFRRWIIHIGTGQIYINAVPEHIDVVIAPSVLLNYTIFIIAFLLCLLLNMMITIIPAWRASRREIVYSLHNK